MKKINNIIKTLSVLSAVLMMLNICKAQNNDFYDKVLDSSCQRFCNFVVLDIETKNHSKKVVVESADLFILLKKVKRLNEKQSKKLIYDLLQNNQKLSLIKLKSTIKSDFYLNIEGRSGEEIRVSQRIKEVDEIAFQGCISLVSHYFIASYNKETSVKDCHDFISKTENNYSLILKPHVGLAEQTAIIEKLFGWKIPVHIDHDSNTLMIDKK